MTLPSTQAINGGNDVLRSMVPAMHRPNPISTAFAASGRALIKRPPLGFRLDSVISGMHGCVFYSQMQRLWIAAPPGQLSGARDMVEARCSCRLQTTEPQHSPSLVDALQSLLTPSRAAARHQGARPWPFLPLGAALLDLGLVPCPSQRCPAAPALPGTQHTPPPAGRLLLAPEPPVLAWGGMVKVERHHGVQDNLSVRRRRCPPAPSHPALAARRLLCRCWRPCCPHHQASCLMPATAQPPTTLLQVWHKLQLKLPAQDIRHDLALLRGRQPPTASRGTSQRAATPDGGTYSGRTSPDSGGVAVPLQLVEGPGVMPQPPLQESWFRPPASGSHGHPPPPAERAAVRWLPAAPAAPAASGASQRPHRSHRRPARYDAEEHEVEQGEPAGMEEEEEEGEEVEVDAGWAPAAAAAPAPGSPHRAPTPQLGRPPRPPSRQAESHAQARPGRLAEQQQLAALAAAAAGQGQPGEAGEMELELQPAPSLPPEQEAALVRAPTPTFVPRPGLMPAWSGGGRRGSGQGAGVEAAGQPWPLPASRPPAVVTATSPFASAAPAAPAPALRDAAVLAAAAGAVELSPRGQPLPLPLPSQQPALALEQQQQQQQPLLPMVLQQPPPAPLPPAQQQAGGQAGGLWNGRPPPSDCMQAALRHLLPHMYQ